MQLLHSTLAALFLGAVAAVATDPRAPPTVPPGTIFCEMLVAQTGPPIVAVSSSSAINGLQVTTASTLPFCLDIPRAGSILTLIPSSSLIATQPSLVADGFKGGYSFSNGGIGALDRCHAFYLNIIPSDTSYKPLWWQFDNQVTNTWSAGPSQLIATTGASATSKFIACGSAKGGWFLYLQTGTDLPPGVRCYETQLQVADGPSTGI
ncbi:hypothetical protein FRB94_002001 [Tulasnella sp. JGI-2019a]|nr:hypothetical protein FRB94_002001 [Tulasnella sp. JGI-2019a]